MELRTAINDAKHASASARSMLARKFRLLRHATHTSGPCARDGELCAPPGFPTIEIEGRALWDAVCLNTPLQWVVESSHAMDTWPFRMDSLERACAFHANMAEVMTRPRKSNISRPYPCQLGSL